MRDVQRDKKFGALVERLTEIKREDSKKSIFPTIRELLCFSALVGFHYKRKEKLGVERDPIPYRVFENSDEAQDLLFALALIETEDVGALHEDADDEIITNFEEYANGGLEIVETWLKELPTDAIGDQAIMAALQNHGFLGDEKVAAADIAGAFEV